MIWAGDSLKFITLDRGTNQHLVSIFSEAWAIFLVLKRRAPTKNFTETIPGSGGDRRNFRQAGPHKSGGVLTRAGVSSMPDVSRRHGCFDAPQPTPGDKDHRGEQGIVNEMGDRVFSAISKVVGGA